MAKFYNTFEFVGQVAIPKESDKFKPYRELDNNKGWKGRALKLLVKNKGTSQFLEMMEGYMTDGSTKVYSFTDAPRDKDGRTLKDKDGKFLKGEKKIIAWKDRQDPKVIATVADFKKIIVDLDNPNRRFDMIKKLELLEKGEELSTDQIQECIDRHSYIEEDGDIKEFLTTEIEKSKKKKREFITVFDAIEFLNKAVPQFGEKLFIVKGNVMYKEYQGKISENFEPQSFVLAEEGEKPRFRGNIEMFFNKDSLDESFFAETKKLFINGFVNNYDSKLKKDAKFPKIIIIDGSKVDVENEKQVKRLDFLKKPFVMKGKKYFSVQVEVNFLNGSEKADITIDQLDDFQKEQIELGFESFEDIKKKMGGNSYGAKIQETKIIKRNEDAKETDLKEDDFIVLRAKDENFDDAKKDSAKKANEEKKVEAFDEDDDDLFG